MDVEELSEDTISIKEVFDSIKECPGYTGSDNEEILKKIKSAVQESHKNEEQKIYIDKHKLEIGDLLYVTDLQTCTTTFGIFIGYKRRKKKICLLTHQNNKPIKVYSVKANLKLEIIGHVSDYKSVADYLAIGI